MYGIFTYIYHQNQPNVGKYTSPMDPMGYVLNAFAKGISCICASKNRGIVPATTSAYARRTSVGPKRNARDGSWTCLGPFDWQLGLQMVGFGFWLSCFFSGSCLFILVRLVFFQEVVC